MGLILKKIKNGAPRRAPHDSTPVPPYPPIANDSHYHSQAMGTKKARYLAGFQYNWGLSDLSYSGERYPAIGHGEEMAMIMLPQYSGHPMGIGHTWALILADIGGIPAVAVRVWNIAPDKGGCHGSDLGCGLHYSNPYSL